MKIEDLKVREQELTRDLQQTVEQANLLYRKADYLRGALLEIQDWLKKEADNGVE